MRKTLITLLALVAGFILFLPNTAYAATSDSSVIAEIDPTGVLNKSAPQVSLEEIEGKVERGGSQIYSLITTVVINSSYIGFAVGILWLIFGFGKSGRAGGVWFMAISSIAYFLIGYGPSIVGWLGNWFESL